MIDGRNFFGQPVKDDIKTYENLQENATAKKMIIQLVVY